MPFLAFNSVLYYNQSGGMMTGPYGNNIWSPHEAGALQRIAGRRAVAGNYNAPGNIGEFLNDLPAANHVRFVNGAGQPLAGAGVRWYAAGPGPGYGGKTFDNTPEYTLTADADGYVHLPRDPFVPGQHREAVVRVASGGQVWYRFFEVAEMNLEYWRGHTQDGYYTVELPLRSAPPEMEVQGLGRVIADGDATPSAADLTDFGEVNVTPAGPNDGYVIRTFVIKNRGGQPLSVDGVSITGANAADFSVVYQPATSLTSETVTVLQVKFDPHAQGIRTANVAVFDNDSDEGTYNFAVKGNGVVPGAQTFGAKFDDRDGDGQQDAGEPGMAGWTVFGDLNDNGILDAGEPSTLTAAGGEYVLYGLPTNAITHVREVQRGGWRLTAPAEGYHAFNPFIDAIPRPMDFGNTRAAAGAFVFYNNSSFDNRDPAANPADDNAIATDKAPLRPGGTPGFGNVTSYARGLNGLMIDVFGLSVVPGPNDVTLLVGNGGDPSAWAPAPKPAYVALRPGAGVGGSTRVNYAWPDGAIRNTWLRVAINPTANTGLTTPDVFYFGNLVGETDAAETAMKVDAQDVLATRAALGGGAAGVTNTFDLNRDGAVDAKDYATVRRRFGTALTPPALAGGAAGVSAGVAAVPVRAAPNAPRSQYVPVRRLLLGGDALPPSSA
jgi:hypothetical protein